MPLYGPYPISNSFHYRSLLGRLAIYHLGHQDLTFLVPQPPSYKGGRPPFTPGMPVTSAAYVVPDPIWKKLRAVFHGRSPKVLHQEGSDTLHGANSPAIFSDKTAPVVGLPMLLRRLGAFSFLWGHPPASPSVLRLETRRLPSR